MGPNHGGIPCTYINAAMAQNLVFKQKEEIPTTLAGLPENSEQLSFNVVLY